MRVQRAPVWRRVVYVACLVAASVVLSVRIVDGDAPAIAALAVPLLPVLAWRLWVSRVEVGDGMRVVGVFGTRFVAWDEVPASGGRHVPNAAERNDSLRAGPPGEYTGI